MMLSKVHYLPIVTFILMPSSFIITYLISIFLGHVEVTFPYISDTGVHVPESCIFSQLFNIVSFLMAANIYIRYKQVEQQCRDHLLPDTNRVLSRNRLALIVGLLSCLGLSIVANFQELQLFTIHIIGGFSAFGFGLVYLWLQTHSSYMMYPIVKSGLTVARVRLALSIILTCTFIVSGILGPLSMRYFHGRDPTKWQPNDGGYLFHVISSISEWISAFAIDFFILSFAHEFKYMSISSPKFYILSTVINIEERRSIDSNYGINVVTSSDISRSQRSRQTRNRDLVSRSMSETDQVIG